MTFTVFLSFLSLPPLSLCIDRRHCLTCLCCAEYFHTIIGINLCNVHQHMCFISLITWMHLFTGKSVCYLHIRCRYTLVFLSLGVCPDWWLFQWFLVKNNVFWVISRSCCGVWCMFQDYSVVCYGQKNVLLFIKWVTCRVGAESRYAGFFARIDLHSTPWRCTYTHTRHPWQFFCQRVRLKQIIKQIEYKKWKKEPKS